MSTTTTPFDAWLLGRIQAHDDTTPELLDTVSDRWKPMAASLAAKPLGDRVAAFKTMLAALPEDEAAALEAAIDDIDSDGPPPHFEPVIEAVDSWGPLRIGDPPTVEPFPMDVLPPALADLVAEGANSIGCPRDLIAVPALAVAGGVIGRSVSLRLKPNYFASPTLWTATVGVPSDGKSPALAAASKPLRRIDRVLQEEHAQAKERWADECASHDKKRKPPAPPRPKRIDVDDATWECLVNRMADNQRGLVMVHDELAILLSGMNQYKAGGKGSDRPTACKIWSGASIKRDRVATEFHEPIRCPHPSLSITGALTPDMLGEMIDAKGRGDGFMDRFLFTYPDAMPSPEWSEHGIPDEVADRWAEIVDRLWSRQLAVHEGRSVPHVAHMTPRGKAAWTKGYDDHSDEMNDPEFSPSLRGPWGKLREYAGRLSLVLALLDHAADLTADALAVPDVDERHVQNAWRLVTYFKSHAQRVYAVVRLGVSGPEAAVVKAIVEWLRDGCRETFTERDVKRARPWIEHDTLAKALIYMASANAIRRHEPLQETAKPGRPPSPTYDVNPSLYS